MSLKMNRISILLKTMQVGMIEIGDNKIIALSHIIKKLLIVAFCIEKCNFYGFAQTLKIS